MTKKVFRPFWSYDVQATEQWLSTMSAQGYHLQSILPGSMFSFTRGEPRQCTYFLGYSQQRSPLTAALQKDGWTTVFSRGKWHGLANAKPVAAIKTYPLREELLARNKMIMYVTGFFAITHFILFFLISLVQLMLLGQPLNFVPSPFWAVHVIFYLWAYYSFIKLVQTNQKLADNTPPPHPDQSGDEAVNNNGDLIRKVKLGWMYAPDKLERWLEEMEQKGYNLQHVDWSATVFYFATGHPRQIKYSLDFHKKKDEGYFGIHRDAGWKQEFTTGALMDKWTLWSQAYNTDEELPQLYSNKTEQLANSRQITLRYTSLLIFLLIINSYNLRSYFAGTYNLNWWSLILFAIAITTCAFLTGRTWLYYSRMKKQLNSN